MVYFFSVAMTFLYQVDTADHRKLEEFEAKRLQESLGLPSSYTEKDCQSVIMDYFKLVSSMDIVYHASYSVVESFADWSHHSHTVYRAEVPRETRRLIQLVINGVPLDDNFAEYLHSGRGDIRAVWCFTPVSQVLSPAQDPIPTLPFGSNHQDFYFLHTNEAGFFQCVCTDLEVIARILYRGKNCCFLVSLTSYGPYRYMAAMERLDDIIAILAWIVSEFHEVNTYHPRTNAVMRAWVSRFSSHPYELLLARAYNLRLYQSGEHPKPTKHGYVVYPHVYVPCGKHYFRHSYQSDQMFPPHCSNIFCLLWTSIKDTGQRRRFLSI